MHTEHELVAKGLARWYNGRLIPIMRGGDGTDEPLFTLPPEDLSGFDDAELAALALGLRQRVVAVNEGRRDPEVVGQRLMPEVRSETATAYSAIERVEAELAVRTAEDTEFDAAMDDLAARAAVAEETPAEPDPEDPAPSDPDPEDPEATTAAAEVAEPVAPAVSVPPARPRPLPAARRHRPVQTDESVSALRVTSHAAGLGAPYDAMTPLDRTMLGDFLFDVVRRNRVTHGQKAVLAHASYSFPRDRMLEDGPDGYLINSQKIRDVVPSALTASGANCAPLPPVYELNGVETPARPVRGANPSFQAARGGVQLGVTPKMGTYADAVGVVTAAENAAGGTSAVKSCMRIECPDFNPTSVDSIYQCIEADNLAARAYPELMARIGDLVMAEQARLADSKLLTAIKTGSTNVTSGAASPGGARFQYLGAVLAAAAGIRSRNRMPQGAQLQGLWPAWLIDLITLDEGREADQANRAQTRASIETFLAGQGITPTFYLDGPATGTGQVFDPQTAGALIEFPSDVQGAIYPTGSWLHLDAGELQLGVVRDSSLNSTNDFQIFAETWENIAFTGVESLWLTITLCPSGASAAGDDVSSLC